jgi:predicted phage baseplate assembly protein
MSVWWGREGGATPLLDGDRPRLVDGERRALADAVRARTRRYTKRWLGAGRDDDAGEAFVRIFADMAAAVGRRVNRLPDRAAFELLRSAGVVPILGTPATTLVRFTVSTAAPAPVFIARGFRLGAPPAAGDLERVEFETTQDLHASPGTLARVLVQQGAFFSEVAATDPLAPGRIAPFATTVTRDRALWLGIESRVHPGRRLKLAIGAVARELPRPQSAGMAAAPLPPPPVLAWEVLDGGRFVPATVVADETASLSKSGLCEIDTPRTWTPATPAGVAGEPLYWLRVRMLSGSYEEAPDLGYVLLNCTRAAATVTLRNQVLEPLDGLEGVRWRLPRGPVVPGSLRLVVDDPAAALAGEATTAVWSEGELESAGPRDRVYELDAGDGVVTFGDGVRGQKLPFGFRHVRAESYRVAFGAESAIEAGTLTTLLSSAPLLLGAENPLAASGGQRAETAAEARLRGPDQIRAGGRAVVEADYGLIARQADGAVVTRAIGVANRHPALPGVPLAGVVGVLVLGRRREAGPPLPSEEELLAVARHVSEHMPTGIEVVASAPHFHAVTVEVAFVGRARIDAAAAVVAVKDELDRYFDPLHGGEDGLGWPFGGTIVYSALLRRLLSIGDVVGIERLTLTVDGRRVASCEDCALEPHALLWPGGHEVVLVAREEEP